MSREPVILEGVVCIAETDAAILVRFRNNDEEWIPKSQIEGGDVHEKDDEGDLSVSAWLANERGW